MVQTAKKGWGQLNLARHFEGEIALRGARAVFGISGYALAKLLGVRQEHHLKWFNGSRRPGPKYLTRLGILHVMHNSGVPLRLADHIDWDRCEVVYKKGVTLGDRKDFTGRGRDPIQKFIETYPEAKA